MTTSILGRSFSGIAFGSDSVKSFINPDGTLTTVPGHKLVQASGKVVVAIVGTGGYVGIDHLITANLLHVEGEELPPSEAAARWIAKMPSLMPLCGVDQEATSIGWFCGVFSSLDGMTKGQMFSPVRSLPSDADAHHGLKALDEVLDAAEALIKGLQDDANISAIDTEAAREVLGGLKGQSLVEHLCDELGLDLKPTPAQARRVVSLASSLLTKDYDNRDEARLIFAGFGADELVATITAVSFYGIIGDQVLYSVEHDNPATGDPITCVKTFAQSDGQSALMHGMYEEDVVGFATTAGGMAKEMFNLSDDQADQLAQRVGEVTTRHLRSNYFDPFLRTVGGLGVEGLARVVDLLCRAQELRAASAYTEASVGGVIEVVTITKREGIVWQRRLSSGLNANEGGLIV